MQAMGRKRNKCVQESKETKFDAVRWFQETRVAQKRRLHRKVIKRTGSRQRIYEISERS